MKTNRYILLTTLMLTLMLATEAETRELTLEACRQLAIEAVTTGAQEELQAAAADNRRAAYAAAMPKVSANMGYHYTNMQARLLPSSLDLGAGEVVLSADGQSTFFWNEGSTIGQALQAGQQAGAAGSQIQAIATESGQMVADGYKQLYEALDIDMRNLFVAQIGVTQPIYVGGRLKELYTLSQIAEESVCLESKRKQDEVVVKADEAYWRVVAVEQKQKLANQYYDLLVQMEENVEKAVESGMATKSDLLKVKQKRGEAELKKLQASNGLKLSKMALCQVCGLPLETDIKPVGFDVSEMQLHDTLFDAHAATSERIELQMLENASRAAESSARIAEAGLKPNIVATANYVYSNMSADNGLHNDWRGHGFVTAGVAVNIPIAHADDIYRVRAARHSARAAQMEVEEMRHLFELQAQQMNNKLLEAQQKVAMCEAAMRNAEEILRLATRSWEEDMLTSSDVLQAQTAWMSAATDLLDAQIEVHVCESYMHRYTNN